MITSDIKVTYSYDTHNPYIVIEYPDGSRWKYSGFEYGEMYLMKKRFKYTPGKLANHLKSKDYVKAEKLN
jgi:hypothetical protein